MIRVTDLRKCYKSGEEEIHALRGVSFEVPKGAFTFIVGPSGSGKTTLAMVLLRFLDYASGQASESGASGEADGAGTVTLNGSASQIIFGSSTTTFNNLTITNTSASITDALNISVSGTLTVNSGATLDVQAVINGAGSVSVSGTGVGGIGALISSLPGNVNTTVNLAASSSIGGASTLSINGTITGSSNLFSDPSRELLAGKNGPAKKKDEPFRMGCGLAAARIGLTKDDAHGRVATLLPDHRDRLPQ